MLTIPAFHSWLHALVPLRKVLWESSGMELGFMNMPALISQGLKVCASIRNRYWTNINAYYYQGCQISDYLNELFFLMCANSHQILENWIYYLRNFGEESWHPFRKRIWIFCICVHSIPPHPLWYMIMSSLFLVMYSCCYLSFCYTTWSDNLNFWKYNIFYLETIPN